jgi:non-ribosomal peptide synthetase component F
VSFSLGCTQSKIARLADEWAVDTSFYNICGPTEITILNTAHLHTPGELLSIGRPLPNTKCYILDDNEQPILVGQRGTMWVGGAGVTKGYINLPELTSSRYKHDKFMQDGSVAPCTTYGSGCSLQSEPRCSTQAILLAGKQTGVYRCSVAETLRLRSRLDY